MLTLSICYLFNTNGLRVNTINYHTIKVWFGISNDFLFLYVYYVYLVLIF